mmetsp:Transcript_162837/g.517327  ORF Transcript_162837/g.517327 Transcript_162837/m.517327 type:complete len:208 (-) Transcript_162837:7-630(-)
MLIKYRRQRPCSVCQLLRPELGDPADGRRRHSIHQRAVRHAHGGERPRDVGNVLRREPLALDHLDGSRCACLHQRLIAALQLRDSPHDVGYLRGPELANACANSDAGGRHQVAAAAALACQSPSRVFKLMRSEPCQLGDVWSAPLAGSFNCRSTRSKTSVAYLARAWCEASPGTTQAWAQRRHVGAHGRALVPRARDSGANWAMAAA